MSTRHTPSHSHTYPLTHTLTHTHPRTLTHTETQILMYSHSHSLPRTSHSHCLSYTHTHTHTLSLTHSLSLAHTHTLSLSHTHSLSRTHTGDLTPHHMEIFRGNAYLRGMSVPEPDQAVRPPSMVPLVTHARIAPQTPPPSKNQSSTKAPPSARQVNATHLLERIVPQDLKARCLILG